MITEQRIALCSVETKFIPPSATLPARIRVQTLSERPIRKYYSYEYDGDGIQGAHRAAAEQFLAELEWNGPADLWHMGATECGYVLVRETAR